MYYTVTMAESAAVDLEDIRAWYANVEVPEAGDVVVKNLVARIRTLREMPERARMVPEFEESTLRELIEPPYRIVFRLDDARVRVVRVFHSARLMTSEEIEGFVPLSG